MCIRERKEQLCPLRAASRMEQSSSNWARDHLGSYRAKRISDTSDGDLVSEDAESADEAKTEDGEEAKIEEGGSVNSKQEVPDSPLRRSSGNVVADVSMSTDEADEDEVLVVVL